MWCREQKIAVAAMFALSVSYGVAGFTARELQQDMGTWQQLALQSWFGCAVAWMIVWITQRRLLPAPISARGRKELIARAVVGRVFGSVTFIQACLYAPLGNVGWISALPMSVVFACLVWGERVSVREVSLLGVGVLGVALIVSPSFGSFSGFGFGELCALTSAIVVGFASRLGRGSVKEADAWSATVWMLGVTAITATLVAIVFEGGLVLPSIGRGPVFALVVGMVVAGSWGSLYGYTHLPASVATGILTLEAVWAMLVGYFVYSEVPTAPGILGGTLIAWSAYAMKVQSPKVAVAATARDCNR
jgi:drug/metabolite transporter (DMT)-like permease